MNVNLELQLNPDGTVDGQWQETQPSVIPFSYEMASATVRWNEGDYLKTGNLDYFNRTANKAQVDKVNLSQQDLTKLVLGNNLSKLAQVIAVNNGRLRELDPSTAPDLTVLFCNDCAIGGQNLRNNPKLRHYNASNNRFSALDITANAELQTLRAYGLPGQMDLHFVDTSKNPQLQVIDLGGCPLTVEAVNAILVNLDKTGLWNTSAMLFGTAVPTVLDVISRLKAKNAHLELDGGLGTVMPR